MLAGLAPLHRRQHRQHRARPRPVTTASAGSTAAAAWPAVAVPGGRWPGGGGPVVGPWAASAASSAGPPARGAPSATPWAARSPGSCPRRIAAAASLALAPRLRAVPTSCSGRAGPCFAVVFSTAEGTFHSYYTSALVPGSLPHRHRRRRVVPSSGGRQAWLAVLGAAIAPPSWLQLELSGRRRPGFYGWTRGQPAVPLPPAPPSPPCSTACSPWPRPGRAAWCRPGPRRPARVTDGVGR